MSTTPICTRIKASNLLIDICRENIRRRYEVEQLRRFAEFSTLTDQTSTMLRDFFLDRLYPPSECRETLDDAFDSAIALARSPAKLLPLTGAVLKSLWRLGSKLPAAMSTGTATLEAYRETRRLESAMQGWLVANSLTAEDMTDDRQFARMIAGVPQGEILKFRRELLRLFGLLGDVALIRTILTVFEQCLHVMRTRPDRYSKAEQTGFMLGCDVLSGGIELFGQLEPAQIPLIICGIDKIEVAWYGEMLALDER